MTDLSPRARHHGPSWFRFGWSQIVNGLGMHVGWSWSAVIAHRRLVFRVEIKR